MVHQGFCTADSVSKFIFSYNVISLRVILGNTFSSILPTDMVPTDNSTYTPTSPSTVNRTEHTLCIHMYMLYTSHIVVTIEQQALHRYDVNNKNKSS